MYIYIWKSRVVRPRNTEVLEKETRGGLRNLRFDRGAASAINFASAEDLAREPPTGLSRRPVPPPGPPPTVEEPPPRSEPGSWRWVWVPDQPDVRDQPSYRAERDSVADSESTARSERENSVVSTSVATVPEPKRTPRKRSKSPIGVAKRSAAKKPPVKKPPVKKPPVAREEPEVEESATASSSNVVVPSESHRGIIDKTALLVVKGGEGYEDRILREQDHSRFYFLKPGDVHRPYYEQKLAECRARLALASASGAPKAAAPETRERPLVALGYHRTIEFNQTLLMVLVRGLITTLSS